MEAIYNTIGGLCDELKVSADTFRTAYGRVFGQRPNGNTLTETEAAKMVGYFAEPHPKRSVQTTEAAAQLKSQFDAILSAEADSQTDAQAEKSADAIADLEAENERLEALCLEKEVAIVQQKNVYELRLNSLIAAHGNAEQAAAEARKMLDKMQAASNEGITSNDVQNVASVVVFGAALYTLIGSTIHGCIIAFCLFLMLASAMRRAVVNAKAYVTDDAKQHSINTVIALEVVAGSVDALAIYMLCQRERVLDPITTNSLLHGLAAVVFGCVIAWASIRAVIASRLETE